MGDEEVGASADEVESERTDEEESESLNMQGGERGQED